jgi:hypothetical protein
MPAPGTYQYDLEKVRSTTNTSNTYLLTPSSQCKTPFRFLDLPKELRLQVYERIPIVTRHHRIEFRKDNENHTFTILSKHVPGIYLLESCPHVYSEAISLRKRLQAPNTEPLRLILHWRATSGAILRAVLRCASKKDDNCSGSSDLNAVFHEMQKYAGGKL